MTITRKTYAVCATCGEPMTFLEWANHTHADPAPRLVYQVDPGDEPEPVYEVLEFDPYGRGMWNGSCEVVVRTRYGISRTSTRYLQVV